MHRRFFYAGFFASPAVAIAIYAIRLHSFADVYFLSVALGLAAYTYLCNQFILAARPGFFLHSIGAKKLQVLHVSMPVLVLVLAALHRLLKLGLDAGQGGQPIPAAFPAAFIAALGHGLGFRTGTTVAGFGRAAWWLLLVLAILSSLLFAKTFFLRFAPVRKLRNAAIAHGFGEEKLRRGHAVMALAGLALLVHVLMSSSSAFSSNLAGVVWLLGYLAACVTFYAVTMIRHQRQTGSAGADGHGGQAGRKG